MKMSRSLAATIKELLAADTTILAAASANKVALITTPITPTFDTVYADLDLASAGGLAPLAGVSGTQLASYDPVTGEEIIEIKPPAGGFRWETTGFTPPVTVFGFALINNAATVLIATEMLAEPITLTDNGQSVTAPALLIRIDPLKIV